MVARRVPVVGGGDADDVDVLAVVDLAEVGLGLDLVAVLLFELVGPLGEDFGVGVAEHGDLDAGGAGEAFHVGLAAAVDAEDGGADGVVGPRGRARAARLPAATAPAAAATKVLRFSSDMVRDLPRAKERNDA